MVAAVGLQSRYVHAGWQLELLEHLSRLRIDAAIRSRRLPRCRATARRRPRSWYTITDEFDLDFGVDEWHGTNAFFRDGQRVFRTYFLNNRGDEAMGGTWSYLDITALGRQELWEDSPAGYPQTEPYKWWNGTTRTTTRALRSRRTLSIAPSRSWRRRPSTHATSADRTGAFARAPQPLFFAVAALVFTARAAATIRWCAAMTSMPEMPMPGGWTMSMMWMRMPGQSWLAAAASFVAMWGVMMVAMMLPPLVAMLTARADAPTAIAAAVYLAVWTAIGVLLFPLGVALASLEMQQPALARAIPTVSALLIVLPGAMQFTA